MKDKRHVQELALPSCVLIAAAGVRCTDFLAFRCRVPSGSLLLMCGTVSARSATRSANQLAVHSLVVTNQRPECLGLTYLLPVGEVTFLSGAR